MGIVRLCKGNFAVIAMLLFMVLAATAADAQHPIDTETEPETAPVMIDGKLLLRVRGTTAYPASQRAHDIAGRIRAFARNAALAPDAIKVEETAGSTNLLVGGRRLLSVFDADAALEGLSRQALAEVHSSMIRRSVESYRANRTPDKLVRHGLFSLGATIVLVLLIFAVRWTTRRIMVAATRRYELGLQRLPLPFLEALHPDQMKGLTRGVLQFIRMTLVLILVYTYLQIVLGILPWTRSFAAGMFDMVIAPLATIGRSTVESIPKLLFLAALWFVVRALLRLLRLFFDTIAAGTVTLEGFDPEWAQPTFKILRLLVVAFSLVVAFPYIPGSETGAFKGVSLFIGVMFSLGSSSLIANIIAGYTMTYRRAFKIGDRVGIGDAIGDVTSMRLQVTHLKSLKNEEVVIPNSVILNGPVVNYSTLAATEGLILHTTVGIGYETPWRQVEAMLRLAAQRTANLLETPEPYILQKSLGDFCIVYELNAYCNAPRLMYRVYTDLHRNILDVFNEYGVQIMTPAYEGDPQEPKVVPKDRWHAEPAPSPAKGQP